MSISQQNTECINIQMYAPSEYYGYAPQNDNIHKDLQLRRTSRNNSGDSTVRKGSRPSDKKQQTHFQYNRMSSAIKSQCGHFRRKQPSEAGSNIRDRIEKACKTFSTNDMKKEINLLRKELQRLQKEILKKDQQIMDLRASVLPSKESRAEIQEVYRTLHFYQGKTAQLEHQIQKFRLMILNSPPQGVTELNLSMMFDELRKDNEQLHANLEQAMYHKWTMDNKYKKLQSNYFEIHRQLAEVKRKQASPLNNLRAYNETSLQKMNRVVNQIIGNNAKGVDSMENKQQQVLLRHYSNRLLKTQDEIAQLRQSLLEMEQKHEKLLAENNILKIQIKEKDEHNSEMFKKYALMRKSLREIDPTFSMNKLESFHKLDQAIY